MKKTLFLKMTVFTILSILMTYVVHFVFVIPNVLSDRPEVIYSFISTGAMVLPALSVVLTVWIFKDRINGKVLSLHLNKLTMPYYALAWFLPIILVLLGGALYFILNPGTFDWNVSYGYSRNVIEGSDVSVRELRNVLISRMITGVIIGPFMHCYTAFGVEWGFRGYLLPRMMKAMPILPAVLLNGLICGIWYIPFVVAGNPYAIGYVGYPFYGILCMLLYQICFGVVSSYLVIRTGTCVPSIALLGAMNAASSFLAGFTFDGGEPLIGPTPYGLVGMIPLIITAVILSVSLCRNKSCMTNASCDTID